MMWKILNSDVDFDPANMFEISHERRTRGHALKLVVPRSTRDLRRRSFSVRCINRWNSLPSSVVCSQSLNSFKVGLDRVLGDDLYRYL